MAGKLDSLQKIHNLMSYILDIMSRRDYYMIKLREVRNMKTKASILFSILIAGLIIAFVAAYASKNDNMQTLQFSTEVMVKDGELNYESSPIYFKPVGDTCEFEIEVSSYAPFLTEVKITTDSPANEPIYDSSIANGKLSTGELKVNDKNIYVDLVPSFKADEPIEDGEYFIGTVISLHPTEVNVFRNVGLVVSAIAAITLLAFAIIMSNKNNEKQYDERQIRARGASAINSMFVMLTTALGLAMISYSCEDFPLNVFACCLMIAMAGTVTFLVTADMNDAFFGLQDKRTMLSIVYLLVGCMAMFSFIMNTVTLKKGLWTELKITTLVIAVSFLIMGIEMVVHGIIEKKEALADEKS